MDSIRSDERKKLASELAEETDPEQIKKIKYLIQRYVSEEAILRLNYRVTHHVVPNLPVTSKQKFRFSMRPFVLVSTGYLDKRDVSP